MKVTTEDNIKDFILDGIKTIILTFDDGTEIKLPYVTSIDIDIDKIDISYVNFTSALHNVELENYFSKKNSIVHIHIESSCVIVEDSIESINKNMFYDIPCLMKFRKLRINTFTDKDVDVYVELEGLVK